MPDTHAELSPRVSALEAVSDETIDEAVQRYDRDGFATLGRVVPEPLLEERRARVDAIMLGEIRHEGLFFQHDSASGRYEDAPIGLGWQGPSLAYRKLEKLERDPLFGPLLFQLEAELKASFAARGIRFTQFATPANLGLSDRNMVDCFHGDSAIGAAFATALRSF